MKSKKRSLSLVILLALSGFFAFVWISVVEKPHQYAGNVALITYGIDAELKWIAMDESMDFSVVQDTLSFYAAEFGIKGDALHSHFQLDHCCEDPTLRATFADHSVYHFSFSADFRQPATRQRLLQGMVERGYLQPGKLDHRHGLFQGSASLSLPIPGQPGKSLEIRNSHFDMRFIPRTGQPMHG